MCDVVYGAYHGGDPRKFTPDPGCSTEVEREAHRRACAIFAEHETLPPPSHEHVTDDLGRLIMHIAHGRFGLGVYEIDCGDVECQGSAAYDPAASYRKAVEGATTAEDPTPCDECGGDGQGLCRACNNGGIDGSGGDCGTCRGGSKPPLCPRCHGTGRSPSTGGDT